MNQSPKKRPRRGGRRRAGGGPGRPARSSGAAPAPLAPSAAPPDVDSFDAWDLHPDVLDAIGAMGITVPTPIQRLAIPPALEGRDVIAKAETGTGKTLAFGSVLASRVDPGRASVLGLVLCPTRELAQQVAAVMVELGRPRGLSVALVVGGEPLHPQIDALKGGAQVVVGTPGRVLDLYGQGFLSFPWTEFVVLDEADEMLEIGFIDDVRKILGFTPEERQTMLFSATFPTAVLQLARESTRDPVEVATARGAATVDTIHQSWMEVDEAGRVRALEQLVRDSGRDDVFLVFCDRRTEVDNLLRRIRLPFEVKALHGGYDQPSRFRVMTAFRSGDVKVLLATDVASRGLDIAHVTHVINYSVPQDISDYTHRIGRTGRAGRSGVAITFVTPRDGRRWNGILRDATWDIERTDAPRRGARDGDGARAGRPERSGRGRGEPGRAPRRPEREPEAAAPRDAAPRDATDGRRRDDDRPRAGRGRSGARRDGRPGRSPDEPRRRERGAERAEPRREVEPSARERTAADERGARPRGGRSRRDPEPQGDGRQRREPPPERAREPARDGRDGRRPSREDATERPRPSRKPQSRGSAARPDFGAGL